MTSLRISHDFECSEETFWSRIFFDLEFNRRMYLEWLGFEVWEELAHSEDDASVHRTIRVVPKVTELPGPIRAVLGERLEYRELGTWDRRTRRYRYEVKSATLGDKLKVEGELWCEPLGAERCRRHFVVNVEVKVFGIGGLIEKRLVADLQQNYEASSRHTQEFLAKS